MKLWLARIWPLVFIFVGFALYHEAPSHPFIWDDDQQITNNDSVHSVQNIWNLFSGSSFSTGGRGLQGIYYKPIMTSLYAVLWHFYPANPKPFHLFQISLHILNAILLGLFLIQFFPRALAIGLSLVFLVHPLNVECVVYIADLQENLFFFFGMLALLAFLHSPRPLGTYFGTGVFLSLSLLSKESGILFFGALVGLPLILKLKRQKILFAGLSALTALALYGALRFGVAHLSIRTGSVFPINQADLFTRLMTLPKIIAFYISHFFWPEDLFISQNWVVQNANWSEFFKPLIIDLVFIAFLVGVSVYHRKQTQNRKALFFSLWLLLGLALHAQIFPLDLTVADRWFYFSMVGALGVIACFAELWIFPRWRPYGLVAGVLIITFFSVQSYFRQADWSSGLVLYSHDLALNPNDFLLQNNYGFELFNIGQIERAMEHFQKSVQLAPQWWVNWNALGAAYDALGNEVKAEECYRRSIQIGRFSNAYENLIPLLVKQKRLDEAKRILYNEALVYLPRNETLIQISKQLQ